MQHGMYQANSPVLEAEDYMQKRGCSSCKEGRAGYLSPWDLWQWTSDPPCQA